MTRNEMKTRGSPWKGSARRILNHSSPGTTLAYIGIRREERDAVYLGLNL